MCGDGRFVLSSQVSPSENREGGLHSSPEEEGTEGVDDLDFFIGDEAIDKPTYATKATPPEPHRHCQGKPL